MTPEEICSAYTTWRDTEDMIRDTYADKRTRLSKPLGSCDHRDICEVRVIDSSKTLVLVDDEYEEFTMPLEILLGSDAEWTNWVEAEKHAAELRAEEARRRHLARREQEERETLERLIREHPDWLTHK